MAESNTIEIHGREVTATRIFDAPRALVWRAFTDPDHLKHWWGPNGFSCTFHEFDLRPGGAWNFIMHGPDGKDYENEWVFVEIDWMERIILDHTNFPRHRLTMRFEDADGAKTKLLFQQVFESLDDYEKIKLVALPGLTQNLDRWAAHLPQIDPNRRELTIKRTFAVPRDLVWRAWTDPEELAKWWGPACFTNPVCELDLRPGGAIHIVMRGPDGTDYPMRGEFREIVPPERLVFTNYPVDGEGHQLIDGLTTVTFVERGDTTEMTLHTRAIGLSPQAPYMIAGMGAGWGQSIERLAALVQPA
jgi:uncharacterized protein YndB with AHSA1/START domain